MQIGPDNLHYVAVLMGEIFGHENHIATIPYQTARMESKQLGQVSNWLVWYAKNADATTYRQLYISRSMTEWVNDPSVLLENADDGTTRTPTRQEKADANLIPSGWRVFQRWNCSSSHVSYNGRSDKFYHHGTDEPCSTEGWSAAEREKARSSPHYDHICNPDECDQPLPENWLGHVCTAYCNAPIGNRLCPKGRKCGPNCHATAYPCATGRHWSVSLKGLHSNALQARLHFGENGFGLKVYADERPGHSLGPIWTDPGRVPASEKRYIVETPPRVLERILLMTTDPGDLVLDPTCGSGAMPLMAERWGRRWIAVDTSAVSIAVARQRIATADHPYWLLQDTPAGHRREHELAQALLPADQRIPFAPPDAPDYQSDPARGFVLARQQRVSAATLAYGPQPSDIIRHPDRPEADGGKRRVSAAFTVESDLPFTAVNPDAPYGERAADGADTWAGSGNGNGASGGGYSTDAIVQSLETAGIRVPAAAGAPAHTYPVHDLAATIEIPGATHTGAITDAAGAARSALFYICGEDEVAGPFQTRHLSRAARSRGDDYAVIISYGREGDTDTVRQAQGSLTVLQVIANRDHMIPGLAVKADDNALVVISEPDLTIHQEDDGQISIAADALTVYNPATGQVETQDSRSIVAIMTDTDYDTESFCARLWNLPQPGSTSERRLRQIRAAFRSDIDEAKWQRMRSSRTLPFPVPAARTVAVKVIDHTGMEHMKVLTV